jgi:putative MFS transporter
MRSAPAAASADTTAVSATPCAPDIAGRLERLPLSRLHWTMCALLGVAMFFDGYDLFVSGLAMPSLVKAGMLTAGDRAAFISLPLFAAALGSVLAGVIGDRFGRRRLIVANVTIYGLAGLGCACAPNYPVLIVFRILAMLALGMQVPTGYSYLSEFTPSGERGRFQSIMALLVNGSLPVVAGAAWLVTRHTSGPAAWRLLFGVSVLVLPVAFARSAVLPESPRWLASKGRMREAEAIVVRMEAGYAQRGIALAQPRLLPAPARDLGWGALFAPGIWPRTVLAMLFQILHLSSIFVLVNWLPTLLTQRGLSVSATIGFSGIIFIGNLLGPLAGIVLADRIERRWLLIGAALLGAAMGIAYARQTDPAGILLVGIVLTAAIFFISAVGYGAYVPEILPTGVRLRGMGAAALVGRIASAVTPFAVVFALAHVAHPFSIVAGVGLMYALLALSFFALGPNTRGRTLESLEAPLRAARDPGGPVGR